MENESRPVVPAARRPPDAGPPVQPGLSVHSPRLELTGDPAGGDPAERAEGSGGGPRRAGHGIRIGVVDDHRLMLDALTGWLRAEAEDIEVAIAVTRWPELMDHPAFPVDVVLLDLELGDDLPAAEKITALVAAGVPVVVLSMFGDPRRVRQAVSAGAMGYVPKSEGAAELVRAVRAAAAGEGHFTPVLAHMLVAGGPDGDGDPALSPQERRALVLYASGLPLKSVARQLDISVETAKTYLGRVREKYAQAGREARTKIALHRRAVEDGLLADVPYRAE